MVQKMKTPRARLCEVSDKKTRNSFEEIAGKGSTIGDMLNKQYAI